VRLVQHLGKQHHVSRRLDDVVRGAPRSREHLTRHTPCNTAVSRAHVLIRVRVASEGVIPFRFGRGREGNPVW
jgi:hypothetical protein